ELIVEGAADDILYAIECVVAVAAGGGPNRKRYDDGRRRMAVNRFIGATEAKQLVVAKPTFQAVVHPIGADELIVEGAADDILYAIECVVAVAAGGGPTRKGY